MADQKTQQRKSPISWRPPADRWDEFDARVSESGLGRNAFITEAVFGRNRHRPGENLKLAQILALGQAIVARLKPFNAAAAGDPEIKALLEEIRLILIEIRTALFLLMGRKP